MQLEQTVKGGEGHNEYWPLGQGPVEARPPIGIGGKSPFPYTTVHADPHRRFRKVELTRGALNMHGVPKKARPGSPRRALSSRN